MPRQTTGGFVGLLLLTVLAIGVGVASFFFYQKVPSSSHYISENISEKIETANLIQTETAQATTTQSIATSTPVLESSPVENKQETKVTDSKKIILAKNPTDVKAQATTVVIPPPQVSEPTLVVEAGEQPKQILLLGDARLVPFTTIKLTAQGTDIIINSLTVERKGFGSDKIFVEVGVIDHGTERKLNSNHLYVMNKAFSIKQGETEEITLYGNIVDATTLSTYNGQAPSLALIAIDTKAKVEGTLPVVGTMQTVNSSLTIGSITLVRSGLDPAVGRTLYINDKNIIFSGVRGTLNSAEPALLKFFGWTRKGSVSSLDLSNVKICLVRLDTKCFDAKLSPNGRYYSVDFANEKDSDIKIEKGGLFDIYIKGDILPSGVNRTVDFDITTSYDIIAYGITYKNFFYPFGGTDSGTQPEGSFSTTEYPFYNGYSHSIVGGSFNTIEK